MEAEAPFGGVFACHPSGRVTHRPGGACSERFQRSLSVRPKCLWFLSSAIISETRVGVYGGELTHILDSLEHFCQQEECMCD